MDYALENHFSKTLPKVSFLSQICKGPRRPTRLRMSTQARAARAATSRASQRIGDVCQKRRFFGRRIVDDQKVSFFRARRSCSSRGHQT
jgi:hypothetical protein